MYVPGIGQIRIYHYYPQSKNAPKEGNEKYDSLLLCSANSKQSWKIVYYKDSHYSILPVFTVGVGPVESQKWDRYFTNDSSFYRGFTYVEIQPDQLLNKTLRGYSVCSVMEPEFQREKGALIAISRALSQAYDKNTVKKFIQTWNNFKNKIGVKK